VYVLAYFPDKVSAAAAAMAVIMGGGLHARSVALLTPAEIDAAIKTQPTY
jgi:hypothetical protein